MNTETPKPEAPSAPASVPIYNSETLFGPAKVVVIRHAGRDYRLRITAANKLILTA
jgi:hemin uptake protein HemP